MQKCDNCNKNATVVVTHVASLDQYFCDEHLPKFYKSEQIHSIHEIRIPFADAETAPKPAKKKAVAKPAPEPVVEAVAKEPTTTTEAVDESPADSN